MTDEQIHLLTHELGNVLEWEEQCPGVYYLSVQPDDQVSCLGTEYYIIFENAPVSQEVRPMGTELESVPALFYRIDTYKSARWAVCYEVLRYKAKHRLPLPEGESLREAALYGMEMCPDYFGTYPVPVQTPWGHTLRYRSLDNGIYWIETDQCAEVLAVCSPIWAIELSENLLELAGRLEHEDELGYRYFNWELSCVAIFELLKTRKDLTELGLIRKAELMNAIWEYQPAYAMGYNAEEQTGLHDVLGLLLYTMGMEDRELERSVEHMIAMNPEAGTDFIGFWK